MLTTLPLDITGNAVGNAVHNEPHNVASYTSQPYRIIVLNQGPFYMEGLEVRDIDGSTLRTGEDVRPIQLNESLTVKVGKAVYNALAIIKPSVGTDVYVDAQMVGGESAYVGDEVMALLKNLEADNRGPNWSNITEKPDSYTANGHPHALWELYGFGDWTDAVDRMREGELSKSRFELSGHRDQVNSALQGLNNRLDDFESEVSDHIGDTDNPHQVNKTQAGLGHIENYPPPTKEEGIAGNTTRRYHTIHRLHQQIDDALYELLEPHVSNRDNPHNVTASQLGTYTRGTIRSLLSNKLDQNATATNTDKLRGHTYQGTLNDIHSNMPANQILIGRIAPARLGNGNANQNSVLLGNRRWRDIDDIMDEYFEPATNVLYVGILGNPMDAKAHIRNTYTNTDEYPVGTIIIYHEKLEHETDSDNGLAGPPRDHLSYKANVLNAMMRTASGWSTVGGDNIEYVHWVEGTSVGHKTGSEVDDNGARGNDVVTGRGVNSPQFPYS